MNLSVVVSCLLISCVLSLDQSVFERFFKDVLSEEQIQTLSTTYNSNHPIKNVQLMMKTFDDKKTRTKVLKGIREINKWDKFLTKLYNDTLKAAKGLLTSEMLEKIKLRRAEDEQKYEGDFVRIQKDLYDYILAMFSDDEKNAVKDALNSPLKKFAPVKKYEKLQKGLKFFIVNSTAQPHAAQ